MAGRATIRITARRTRWSLLGKMLRIDVGVPDDHPTGYQIPADNPFASGGGPVAALPEIWSFGLRNPWRYSFDDPGLGGTGALVMGDVGQSRFEEIDYEPRGRGGRNYGWRNREGAHDNVTSRPPAFLPLVDPIFEYGRSSGQSVTGGFVYRGRALGASYQGRYFFADFEAGRVWSIALAINPTTGEATASNLVEHTGELGDRRQRELVRHRRRRRAVHRQLLRRKHPEDHRPADRAAGADRPAHHSVGQPRPNPDGYDLSRWCLTCYINSTYATHITCATEPPHAALTRRERQIMDILYRRGRATAVEVMDDLSGDPSYSTVRTQLRVLESKGHVRHDEEGLRYVYMPAVPRHAARKSALRHLVDTFFEGSTEKVVGALLGGEGARLSDAELERIAELVAKAKKEGSR